MPQLAQTEKLTIHYFNMKGAAGLATLCLEQGNCDYEATAHSWDDWQNNFKPKTPTGLMPLFEYSDGTMVPESGALSRVAAAQAGLLGIMELIMRKFSSSSSRDRNLHCNIRSGFEMCRGQEVLCGVY